MKTEKEKTVDMIKDIVDLNPALIIDVNENSREISIMDHVKGITIIPFDEKHFRMAKNIIVNEIKSRPNEDDRIEPWECTNLDGVYDHDIELAMLRQRKNVKCFYAKKMVNKRALAEFSKNRSYSPELGRLHLAELKLDMENHPSNEKDKQRARLLGLM